MLSLIVNADDFGFSETVNDGIIKSFKEGIVRSTSIMANGKAFGQAVELAKESPGLDLGIHLTLVKEKPTLPLNQVTSLINDEDGFMNHAMTFARKYYLNKINLEEIRSELDSQINIVLKQGLQISHMDSHQHVHMFPSILKIVLEFSKRYKIPFIRFPKEHFVFSNNNKNAVSKNIKVKLLNFLCGINKGKISYRTDYFTGFYFDGDLNEKNLLRTLEKLPIDGTCELMCHPGQEDKGEGVSYHTGQETQALMSQEIRDFIFKTKIQLTSFKELYYQNSDKDR